MNDNIEIAKKEDEYRKYIAEHIQNVKKAWIEVWDKCKLLIAYNYPHMTMNQAKQYIEYAINIHDQSKYDSAEFDAYRKNFYPINEDEKKYNEKAFDKAWVHHYMNNPHHWNYWAENGLEEMSYIHIVEMVCDWQAMGYKFGNSAKEYYDENKSKIKLAPKTRVHLETLLETLEEGSTH